MDSYKESSFSRSAWNMKKLGAYYTDVGHARRIGRLFAFDRAREVCVLEPCIGDGKAVLAVTEGQKHCKIFGVEIQKETFRENLSDREEFACILNEDFLKGVKISHGAFSFCFANPPYGELKEGGKGRRLEALFLEKLTGYLKPGAYLALVIPYRVFREEKFFRQIMTRYEICAYYRFDDAEYAKYHQIVVILRKKKSGGGYLRSRFEEHYKLTERIEDYPYLPGEDEPVAERFEVQESFDAGIEYFTTLEFHPEDAAKFLDTSPLYDVIGGAVFPKKYSGCELNHPVIPVSKDIAYLLAVLGGGQGLAGSEEEGTLHLQRGTAKRVEEEHLNWNEEKTEVKSITATSYTKINMTIVENNGKITQF